jgi:hypothetical protein
LVGLAKYVVRGSEIAQVIADIGNVEYLTANKLGSTAYKLFELVIFCYCIRTEHVEGKFNEVAQHTCDKFYHHDHDHLPYCRCCQTRALMYYLGWFLERLKQEGRLPDFNNTGLTQAKIRDRTYGYRRAGLKIYFRIRRHLNAWHQWLPQETVLDKWVFDLKTDIA